MQCMKEIFQDYLYDQKHKIKCMANLENLALIDSGLTYNVCVNKSNRITGFVWMTSVMKSNLYSCGCLISVDFMKRKTNVHLWPYIGPVVMNELKRICVVCKSFMLEGRLSAYYFVLESIFLMAPNFPNDNLIVIYTNGFFSKDILIDLELSHVKLFNDNFHLK